MKKLLPLLMLLIPLFSVNAQTNSDVRSFYEDYTKYSQQFIAAMDNAKTSAQAKSAFKLLFEQMVELDKRSKVLEKKYGQNSDAALIAAGITEEEIATTQQKLSTEYSRVMQKAMTFAQEDPEFAKYMEGLSKNTEGDAEDTPAAKD